MFDSLKSSINGLTVMILAFQSYRLNSASKRLGFDSPLMQIIILILAFKSFIDFNTREMFARAIDWSGEQRSLLCFVLILL